MTIGEAIDRLGVEGWDDPSPAFLQWPPDVFGVAAYLLRERGAYAECVSPQPRTRSDCPIPWFPRRVWRWQVRDVGQRWGENVTGSPPGEVIGCWNLLRESAHLLHGMRDLRPSGVWQALATMMAIADEACAMAAIPGQATRRGPDLLMDDGPPRPASPPVPTMRSMRYLGPIALQASVDVSEHALSSDSTTPPPSTLCRSIPPEIAVVLPKLRTPQSGLTIRSMSHHLSLHSGMDIVPLWSPAPPLHRRTSGRRAYNIMILPVPYKVRPSQFRPLLLADPKDSSHTVPMFTFEHDPDGLSGERLHALLKMAAAQCGRITWLVLPEGAMSSRRARELFIRPSFKPDLDFLVCGTSDGPEHDGSLGRNAALVRVRREKRWQEFMQDKHHRWKIDDAQSRMYHLASTLDPTRNWWEAIEPRERTLRFIELDETCVFTVLICEDLARPDPVGDIVRSVGPNLVIALLQDGPQLRARWPARFAGGLADDPGSSVLSVTSLGMCTLSKPLERLNDPPSRVVAMWRQPGADAREIALPVGAHALVLTVVVESRTEWAADGRDDDSTTCGLTLGAVHAVSLPE